MGNANYRDLVREIDQAWDEFMTSGEDANRSPKLNRWLKLIEKFRQEWPSTDIQSVEELAEWIQCRTEFIQRFANAAINMGGSASISGQAAYREAFAAAVRLLESDPNLPPPPAEATDPMIGVQLIRTWCLEAIRSRSTQQPDTADDAATDASAGMRSVTPSQFVDLALGVLLRAEAIRLNTQRRANAAIQQGIP